jgi:hypothetical protein
LVVLALCILTLAGCQVVNPIFDLFRKKRTPEMYFFPPGFRGWAIVEWNVAGAPAVALKDGYEVVRVPNCRYVAFSTPMDFGSALDRVLLETADGGVVEHLEKLGDSFVFHWTYSARENPEPDERNFVTLYLGMRDEMNKYPRPSIDDFPRGRPCE